MVYDRICKNNKITDLMKRMLRKFLGLLKDYLLVLFPNRIALCGAYLRGFVKLMLTKRVLNVNYVYI